MKYVNATPFPFAALPGKVRPPEWSATLIVKASFALRHGGPAQPLPEPLPFAGDVYRDEDIANACLYEMDFAPWKQNADVLLAGTCHAPGGQATTACRVEFGVGRWSKALAVIGNRQWKKSLLMSAASDPEPFKAMPLTWENAYGGTGFDKNPSGRGYERAYLPNVEPLEDRISGPGDRPDPSGFGPINRTWPQRSSKLGSYRGKWLKERWPYFPDDFDFTYHNAAPEDQQFRKYLRGDEELRFENLHPKHASYRSALPGIRIRGFLSEKIKGAKRFREVPMNLDTLFVDMHQETLVLIWRGVATVLSEELTEVQHALAVSEPLQNTPRPAAEFEALIPPPEPPKPPAPPAAPAEKKPSPMKLELEAAKAQAKKMEAAHLEGARTLAKMVGFDLDAAMAKPPGGTAEIHASLVGAKAAFEKMGANVPGLLEAEIAAVAPGGKVAAAAERFKALDVPKGAKPPVTADLLKAGGQQGKDLSGAKLAGADLSGLDLTQTILKGADLSGAKLVKTVLKGAQLSGANLAGADLSGAMLEKADLSKAVLTGAKLEGANLASMLMLGATAPKAGFAGAQAPKAIFADSNLEGAVFEKALLANADFSRAILKGAKFTGAQAPKAAFTAAKAEGVEFSGADLSGAHGSEGADFKKALFVKVVGPQSTWEESSFEGADFSGAVLERANFAGSSLKQAKISGADAKGASFRKAVLLLAQAAGSDFHEATFEKADLSGADFTGSNLFGAEFLGSVLEGTKLQGANVKMTKLA